MKAYQQTITKREFVPKKKQDFTTIKRAAEFLKNQGWEVFDIKNDSANGPDLTIAKHGRTYRVEIKKALLSKKSCHVKSVKGSGLLCEAIGILLPNDRVILQSMKDHLSLCCNSGTRSITDLVRLNS